MPKEVIRDAHDDAVVDVRWSHDQYVQVASLLTDGATFVDWCRSVVRDDDQARDLWEKKQGAGGGEAYLPGSAIVHGSMGVFWTPTRYQINELIRVLRRARDQAFGRDE